jgi:nitroimidazol reductase NimA-like FMN-containing flavoprotein (pyridoxamine 5'-phosphate oxidase superfamily)
VEVAVVSGNGRHPGSSAGHVDDIAQRIELRRKQLGLTHDGLAVRARMAPRYLQHLTDNGAEFDPDALHRVAAALDLSVAGLLHERADAPPGQRPSAPHPGSMKLGTHACWDRVATHGIGRVGLSTSSGPAIIPVNYTVDNHTIVFRTASESATAATVDTEVAFEVDQVDEQLSQGWSVLMIGRAERVTDRAAVQRLADEPGATPWAGGRRDLVIRIVPTRITGRLIYAA